jgi:trk system potassium uptake protein TrkH
MLCVLAYAAAGMSAFDAICHAMATIATGGFANYDASFGGFGAAVQYAAIVFMALGAMPFIRFIELGRGRARPLLRDTQIQTFVAIILIASAMVAAIEISRGGEPEPAIRAALFNLTSVITTTGFVSLDYGQWSSFGLVVVFILSMIGGCSGSTAGAAKVFRLQILFAALMIQIRRMRNAHGVFRLRYQGQPVEADVVSSIMAFFFIYLLTLGIIAILLSRSCSR